MFEPIILEKKITRPPKYRRIIIGAGICERIKSIYYDSIDWCPDLKNIISKKFTQLKHITRKYYPNMTEEEFLLQLSKFTNQDIKDVLNNTYV